MGDRFFHSRHPNLETLLRRPPAVSGLIPSRLAGIGHNGGPPLDMSGVAVAWRRAHAKAWQAPPREIVQMRLRRAARLGLSYRDVTLALLDRGCHLSTLLLPLHHAFAATRDRDGGLHLAAAPEITDKIARLDGRLFLLLDEAMTGPLDAATRRALLQRINASHDGKVEALLTLPFRPMDTEAQRAQRLRRLLRQHGAPRQECVLLGLTWAEIRLAEAAGLGLFKPVGDWFAG
ncbi:MAG: hypothetical protein ACK4FK_07955 [Ferrovibrio sp.]|jgi:hypothetical protein|uniref:hypothetical protein n=1 Tax=Ferrovibrio sp. TaxID=1917215 RepID=UPI0039194F4F